MILIGAPSWQRDWIIPSWLEHIESAARNADVDYELVLLLDTQDTVSAELVAATEALGRSHIILWRTEPTMDRRRRGWGLERYRHMARLRNDLLSYVRERAPEFYFSLDTDILLHPDALTVLTESIERFDAVGSKCFFTPAGTWAPSYAMFNNGTILCRQDSNGVFAVDAIMAAKLMKPTAYNVDYEPHEFGEDIGWSLACRRTGLTLGWDGRHCSKHVLGPELLEKVDVRCGF